jgi:hypothetical protein
MHYLVMPFLEGQTLKERVEQKGPLSVLDTLAYARTLADLLVFLHSQEPPIVHRDLKPDNVLIRPDRSLVVLDLGAARPLVRGMPGTAIGTPGYAAPEQYQGLADERSDLYALGATMHFMLTGYDAEQETPFRHPPLRQINPNLGPDVEALVAKLLQLAPAARMQSATALSAGLDACALLDQSSTTVASNALYRRRLARRQLPASAGGVAVALISGLNLSGLPARLAPVLGLWALAFAIAVSLSYTARALCLPGMAAIGSHPGGVAAPYASARRVAPITIGLILLYAIVLARPVQWVMAPVLLALPLITAVAVEQVVRGRARRARRNLETVLCQHQA